MTCLLHTIFTPPEPTIYDRLAEAIDRASEEDANSDPIQALMCLLHAKAILDAHLSRAAN